MALTLLELRCLALDPAAQARFWAEVLDVPTEGETVAVPGFSLRFVPTDRPKTAQARIHLDLTSRSPEDQRARVATVLRLGGRHVDVGQNPSDDHVVLADPEGNELCVIPAGNRFLADTGRIGAVNCDGTHALGVFWSRVLGWPLVWDEGEETAVQSPEGGSKFTWSGPPLMARETPERISFHLAAQWPADLARLVELGATALGGDRFLDPDGNDFIVTSG
ncbi:MAG: VOC family protein [Nocardioidaceae bacterium]